MVMGMVVLGIGIMSMGCGEHPTPPKTDIPVSRLKGPGVDADSGVIPKRLAIAARNFRNQSKSPLGINVVVIVVDTLRADRLGAYGYDKNTSPRIDAFASESTLFHRFYAASPWTAPSFATMFTGMSPSLHQGGQVVNDSDNSALRNRAQTLNGFSLYPIRADIRTLAEQLNCCVDVSAAFVSNPFLHPSLGFNRGFTNYNYRMKRRPAKEITDAAISWIQTNAMRQFMTVIHYMDTHQPYDPDESLRAAFFPMDGGRLTKTITQSFGELQRMKLTPTELAFLRGLYDAQINTVDTQIGRVLDAMAALDLMNNTWIIITADHGEEQFDHGSFFHGLQYTDEVVRVPLIIRAPGGQWGAGNEIAYSACQQDLNPTILGFYDAVTPAYVTGKSLMPMMTGTEKKDRTCFMEMSMLRDAKNSNIENRYRKHAIFDGRYKAIQSLDGSETAVYDLDNDALEQHPLTPFHPGAWKTLRGLYQYVENRKPAIDRLRLPAVPTVLPDEASESLKNLGYIK